MCMFLVLVFVEFLCVGGRHCKKEVILGYGKGL